jgi:ParB/RepB/Spo0J family partition protein
VVRAKGDDFELIAGERRWRAAMKAGLTEVPVVVREASDQEALQLAPVETQREDSIPSKRPTVTAVCNKSCLEHEKWPIRSARAVLPLPMPFVYLLPTEVQRKSPLAISLPDKPERSWACRPTC